MENKQPEINRAGHNDIGSPLNTGSTMDPGHIKEATAGTNDRDGDVQKNSQSAVSNIAEKAGKISTDDQPFNGNNDPDANRTPHPGAADGS
jgi:hypothetical protein